jgi:hypothetical protein
MFRLKFERANDFGTYAMVELHQIASYTSFQRDPRAPSRRPSGGLSINARASLGATLRASPALESRRPVFKITR